VRWQRTLDEGIYATVTEIGDAEIISKSYVESLMLDSSSGHCRHAGESSGAGLLDDDPIAGGAGRPTPARRATAAIDNRSATSG
jgi:hypothetical protein